MTSKANLPKRVQKARAAARFIGQIGTSNGTEMFSVPGSDGKRYQVKVRRDKAISLQCWLEHTGELCPGNSNGHNTVCYHSMAVCEVLAERAGGKIAWCASQDDAHRRARINGRTFHVQSHSNGGEMWGVLE